MSSLGRFLAVFLCHSLIRLQLFDTWCSGCRLFLIWRKKTLIISLLCPSFNFSPSLSAKSVRLLLIILVHFYKMPLCSPFAKDKQLSNQSRPSRQPPRSFIGLTFHWIPQLVIISVSGGPSVPARPWISIQSYSSSLVLPGSMKSAWDLQNQTSGLRCQGQIGLRAELWLEKHWWDSERLN